MNQEPNFMGILLTLVGSFLLAGDYLLGKKRLRNIDKWMNQAASSSTLFERQMGLFNSDWGRAHSYYETRGQYLRSMVISSVILMVVVVPTCVCFGLFLSRHLSPQSTFFLTILLGLVVWFFYYLLGTVFLDHALDIRVHIALTSGADPSDHEGWRRAIRKLPGWKIYPLATGRLLRDVITMKVNPVIAVVCAFSFARFLSERVVVLPLRELRSFGKRHGLGHLPALVGACLVILGVVLSYYPAAP